MGYGDNADALKRQRYLDLVRTKWKAAFDQWKQEPSALIYLGQHHLRDGDLSQALELLEAAVAAAPADANALNLCGMANYHSGNRARAVALVEAAARIVPGHPAIVGNLALLRGKSA
jgi:Flp pilus assembly protein TadD